MRFMLIMLAAVLAGCATTANYERALNTWVGVNADNLVVSWGPPQNSYTLSDGGKVLEYDRQRSFQTGGGTYTTPVTTYNSGNVNLYGGGGMVNGNYTGTSTTYVPQRAPVQTWNMRCITRFTVDSNNVIRHWTWEGNDCRAREPSGRTQETQITRQPGQYN